MPCFTEDIPIAESPTSRNHLGQLVNLCGVLQQIMEDYIAAVIGIVVTVVVLFLIMFLPRLILSLWSNDFPNKDKFVETDVQLHGKTAIVTGSSKGIGAMTGKELARRGARVILAVRNIKKTGPIRDDFVQETGI